MSPDVQPTDHSATARLGIGKLRPPPAILIAALLVLALGLRLYYCVGIGINDDAEYCDSARRLATGYGVHSYPLHSIDSIRSLMVLPVVLAYKAFGVSEWSSSLYPLTCSILTILLSCLLARRLFGWQVAVGAGLILSLCPLDVVYSSQLVPTVPLACVLSACLLCFVLGDDLYHSGGRRCRAKGGALLLLSGLLLGAGWLINEPAPLFGIVVVLYAIQRKRICAGHVLFLAGALAVFAAECAVFKSLTGDPLWRLKVVHGSEQAVVTRTELSHYPIAFFKLINIQFGYEEGHFGLFWYLFVPGSIMLLAVREKRAFFLVCGSWLLLLYLQFGVMTLDARPIAKAIRYLVMLLPFLSMVTSLAITRFGQIGKHKWKGWGLLAVLLLTNLWFTAKAVEANRSFTRPLRLIADFLRRQPAQEPIYADKAAIDLLSVYLGRRGYRRIEGQHFAAIQDAFVVVNGSEDVIHKRLTPFAHPENNLAPPASWQLVKRIEAPWETHFGLFRPQIYRVPSRPVGIELETLSDATGDVTRKINQPGFNGDLVDLLSASAGVSTELLALEMELKEAPENFCPQHTQLIYVWLLDLDKDPETGQKHGGIGSELNIRISNERGGWQLSVDDADPSDPYRLGTSPTWFRIGKTRVEARLPAKAFSELPPFNWRAEALARTITRPERLICYDVIPEDAQAD